MVLSDTGNHAVYLIDRRHFDCEGWETGRALLSITSSNSDHLDMVCPTNDESLIVLPFQGAFEQFCSGDVCSPINISYSLLGGRIKDLDALTISSGEGTKYSQLTRSLAQAIKSPLHSIAQIGPSPECITCSLYPNHPFSCIIKFPAIPPQTKLLLAFLLNPGSSATACIGRL